jgi:hypothetical protein
MFLVTTQFLSQTQKDIALSFNYRQLYLYYAKIFSRTFDLAMNKISQMCG